MMNLSQGDRDWLSRRSVALGELVRFVAFSLGRLASPARLVGALALVGAVIAAPWLIERFGVWAWAGLGAAGLAVILVFVLLVISYARFRGGERTREEQERLAAAQGALDLSLRETVQRQIVGLEQRLEAQILATRTESEKQLRGVLAVSTDKADVLRSEVEARIAGAARAQGELQAVVLRLERTIGEESGRLGQALDGIEALRSDLTEGSRAAVTQIRDQEARERQLRDTLAEQFSDLEQRLGSLIESRAEEVRAAGTEQLRGVVDDIEMAIADRMRGLLDDLRIGTEGEVRGLIEDIRLQSEEQLRGVAALTADRVEVLRAELAGKVGEETRARVELGAMQRDLAQRLDQASDRLKAVDTALAGLKAELDRRNADAATAVESRLSAERAAVEAAFSALRSEVEQLLAANGQKASENFAYFRDLLDRRVQAGAVALRDEIETLRAEMQTRLLAMMSAASPDPSPELREEISVLQQRVEEIGDLRVRVSEALLEHDAGLKAVMERQDADAGEAQRLKDELQKLGDRQEAGAAEVETLRLSVSEALQREATERALAIDAVVKEGAERNSALEAAVQATGPALENRIAELRALLEARMGPEFEARLEAWRARLDNEIGAAVQRGRTEDNLANQEREARLRAELQSLHDALLRQREDSEGLHEAMSRSLEAVRSDLAAKLDAQASDQIVNEIREETDRRLQERDEFLVKQTEQIASELAGMREAASNGVEVIEERVKTHVAQAALTQIEAFKAETAELLERVASKDDLESALSALETVRRAAEQAGLAGGPHAEELARLEKGIKDAETRAAASTQAIRRLSDANASIARPFDRLLGPDKIQKIESHWLKTFGINMTRTALAYLAHKICLLEDRGLGRIAAPIETIIMRQLALRSLANRGTLEVMEIGTLFGLGAAVFYNFRGARASGMHLTLVDPLEGYYEAGGADPVTGVEVTESVLRKNLADLEVPTSDYRLIKALSADPRAIREASDRLYDLILVDGDHSTAGVAADFENYGPLVKPGGLMIFDDYGSEHWPGIQPYVDETVRADPNWIWIGADYRTAVVAKKADGATAKVARGPEKAKAAPARRKR